MLDTDPTNAQIEEAARIYYETHMSEELSWVEDIVCEALNSVEFVSLVNHLLYRQLRGQTPSDSWKARKLEMLIEYLEEAGKIIAAEKIENNESI